MGVLFSLDTDHARDIRLRDRNVCSRTHYQLHINRGGLGGEDSGEKIFFYILLAVRHLYNYTEQLIFSAFSLPVHISSISQRSLEYHVDLGG